MCFLQLGETFLGLFVIIILTSTQLGNDMSQ